MKGRLLAGAWTMIGLCFTHFPVTAREPAYMTSESCAGCHAEAYQAWSDSHHGWAWRSADRENVLGDFSGASFEHRGMSSHFTERDGRFYVETAGPDGRPAAWEVTGTVGVTPLQQYLVELEDGRLQALDMAWDTEGERWYHLYPQQELEDDPGLHWTGPYKNWNSRCVSCHVTGFVKGYDPKKDRYRSTWSEMGVGCEACHGPGEAHVAWAEAEDAHQGQIGSKALRPKASHDAGVYGEFVGVDALGFTLDFGGDRQAKAEMELKVCASCHSRRESLGADSPAPGEPFDDHFRLTLLREDLYHADGQIKGEVYVFGSFAQTKKHAAGVTCGDCHRPHGTKLVAQGNAVCTQCHNPQGRPDFPTLKADLYDSPQHHRHLAGSDGAACVNCHMPETTYMGVDPRRDHSFRVPRPDLSVKVGTPNACNGCHGAQSAEWAQSQVAQWNPQGRHLEPHFAEVFAAAREGLDESSVKALVELAKDSSNAPIVRASAVEMLTPAVTPQLAGAALPLLEDPSPWVRSATLGLFQAAPVMARTKYAGPLLEDPSKIVRIAAAQRILDVSTHALGEADRAIVEAAVAEYRFSLAAQADFPEVQLNLGRVAERLGQLKTTEHSLRAALALDPKLAEAWLRLALLEIGGERLGEANETLAKATGELPESGILQQLYGRVLVQLGEKEQALGAFQQALHALSGELEIRLELASLLTQLGRHGHALATLEGLGEVDQLHPHVLYLRSANSARANDPVGADHFARLLASSHPEHELNQHLQAYLNQP